MRDTAAFLPRLKYWAFALALSVLAILPRLPYLSVPFERDEGAYAYVSDTIARGGVPYVDSFDHKPPLVYYIYLVSFKLFGHDVAAPRTMAILFLLPACLFVFAAVYRATDDLPASGAAALFLGIASASPAYTGFNANTEVFTLPFLAGGFHLLAIRRGLLMSSFLPGFLLGVGFVIKPVVAPLMVAGLVVLAWQFRDEGRRMLRSLFSFAVGCLIPFVAFAASFAFRGHFKAFWLGFFAYNASYVAGPTALQTLSLFTSAMTVILRVDPVSWFLWAAGGVLLVLAPVGETARDFRRYLLLMTGAGAVAVAMGKYFYGHYFLVFLPFMAMTLGAGFGLYFRERWRTAGRSVLAAGLLGVCLMQAEYVRMPADRLLELCYGGNPFYQSVALGQYLQRSPGPRNSAYIIGSEPQLLFYSGMRSPSRFFYFYPLTMPSPYREEFQAELLSALSNEMPDYLVYSNCPTSHFIHPELHRRFLQSLVGPFSEYEFVAVSTFGTGGLYDDPGALGNPRIALSPSSLLVFRRPSPSGRRAARTVGDIFRFSRDAR